MQIRYSIILGFLGQLKDRFAVYHQPQNLEEKLDSVTSIEGATGIEPVYPFDFKDQTYDSFTALLQARGLGVSSVNVNLKSEKKFHLGALSSPDPGIRAEAVQYLKTGMDWAAELGNNLVTVCPLSDGHDYPFEVSYSAAWRAMVDCLGEAADYRPGVRLAVEYKQSEPRVRVIVPNAGVVLYLCEQIGLENIGMTVDTGHALYVGETPAQVISLAADAGRLFLVHINDNYRNFDWDLIPGSVNYWDWLETLLVLDEIGYVGWIVSDVFPSRTDPVETLSASYRAIRYGLDFLEKFGKDRLRLLVRSGDFITVFDKLNQMILNGE
jgi:xylose isomerase